MHQMEKARKSKRVMLKTSGDLYEYIPPQTNRNEDDTILVNSIRTHQTKSHNIDYSPIDPSKSYQYFELNASESKGK